MRARRAHPHELSRALAIRREVFVEGQGVPLELEIDGLDPEALHLILEDQGELVGTARMRIVGAAAKAERVAVLARARGRGAGRLLMDALEAEARALALEEVVLHAQTDVLGFYERLGYAAEGPVFDDAGIPHRKMRKRLL